jgi:hypothetical protein
MFSAAKLRIFIYYYQNILVKLFLGSVFIDKSGLRNVNN